MSDLSPNERIELEQLRAECRELRKRFEYFRRAKNGLVAELRKLDEMEVATLLEVESDAVAIRE